MSEVLSVEQARAAGLGKSYPETPEGDALLESRIDSAERWLASRIGPLLGPVRIERLNARGGVRVWLKRPVVADSLTVTLDGDAVTAELLVLPSGELVRADGEYWLGRFVAEYDPDDEDAIREALIKLLRLELTSTGMQSETISGSSYSYQRGDGTTERSSREQVLAELLPLGAGTGY